MDKQIDKIIMECSFCGRSQLETKNMITSPDGSSFICEECVAICGDMLAKTKKAPSQEKIKLPTPRELKAMLDEYVIGQDEAKKVLSDGSSLNSAKLISQIALPAPKKSVDIAESTTRKRSTAPLKTV